MENVGVIWWWGREVWEKGGRCRLELRERCRRGENGREGEIGEGGEVVGGWREVEGHVGRGVERWVWGVWGVWKR